MAETPKNGGTQPQAPQGTPVPKPAPVPPSPVIAMDSAPKPQCHKTDQGSKKN